MGEMNNDRFKFRGKAIVTGDWIYCTLFSPFVMDVIPETVGQCTGLKDKNGRLIYEGDILRYSSNSKMDYDVIFFFNSFIGVDKSGNTVLLSLHFIDCSEIVGNIHEVEK